MARSVHGALVGGRPKLLKGQEGLVGQGDYCLVGAERELCTSPLWSTRFGSGRQIIAKLTARVQRY